MLSGPLYIETVFSSFGFFALALLLIGLKSSAPLLLELWDSEDSRASELSVGSRELFGRYQKGSYGGGSWDLGAKPLPLFTEKVLSFRQTALGLLLCLSRH